MKRDKPTCHSIREVCTALLWVIWELLMFVLMLPYNAYLHLKDKTKGRED